MQHEDMYRFQASNQEHHDKIVIKKEHTSLSQFMNEREAEQTNNEKIVAKA